MSCVYQFSSVSQSRPTLCYIMGAASQGSLFITNSQSLLKLIFIRSVMPPNNFIFCLPLCLLSLIFPFIKVFSKESVLPKRCPKFWRFSFSIGPSNKYSGLISFSIDWLSRLAVQGTSSTPLFKRINSMALSLLYGPNLTSMYDYWKNHSFD